MVERLPDILHGAMLALFLNYALLFLVNNTASERVPDKVRLMAGILMSYLAAESLLWLVSSTYSQLPSQAHQHTDDLINLLSSPLCMLVLMELTHVRNVSWKTAAIHVTPFLAGMMFCHIADVYNFRTVSGVIHILYIVSVFLYSGHFLFTIGRAIRKYDHEVENYYSDTEGRTFRWTRNLLYLTIALGVVYLIMYIILDTQGSKIIFNLFCSVLWSVFAVNILSMKYESDMVRSILAKEETLSDETSSVSENEACGSSNDQISEFMEQIHEVCVTQKLYRNESLTRDDVAAAMLTNHTTLTYKLKEATGMTFSEYIGSLRLEAATKLLLESDEQVEQIIYACGYRNKSTFYRAFS